jgi:hypothetical protein
LRRLVFLRPDEIDEDAVWCHRRIAQLNLGVGRHDLYVATRGRLPYPQAGFVAVTLNVSGVLANGRDRGLERIPAGGQLNHFGVAE